MPSTMQRDTNQESRNTTQGQPQTLMRTVWASQCWYLWSTHIQGQGTNRHNLVWGEQKLGPSAMENTNMVWWIMAGLCFQRLGGLMLQGSYRMPSARSISVCVASLFVELYRSNDCIRAKGVKAILPDQGGTLWRKHGSQHENLPLNTARHITHSSPAGQHSSKLLSGNSSSPEEAWGWSWEIWSQIR